MWLFVWFEGDAEGDEATDHLRLPNGGAMPSSGDRQTIRMRSHHTCFRITKRAVSTPKPWVTVGVDVGKQRDPATIAVTTAERHATPTGRSTVLWIVRSLERLPLGTDYPKVADRIRDIDSP